MKNNFFGLIDLCPKILLVFTAGYLARKLGPELYAGWALLLGLQLLVANLSSFGFTTSMQRFLPAIELGQQNYYFVFSISINFILNFFAFILLYVFKSEIIEVYKLPAEITVLIYPLAFISFLSCIENTLDICIKIQEDIKKYQIYIGYRTLCEMLTLIYFFKITNIPSSVGLLLSYIITLTLLKSLGYVFLLVPYFKTIKVDQCNIAQYVKYGVPTVIASCVLWCFGNLDRVLLTRYMSLYDLGNYTFGASLATYINYLGVLIIPLLLPRLSFLHDTKKHFQELSISKYFNQNLTCMILGVGGVWLFLSLFASELVLITAGASYSKSAAILFVLALYYGIEQIFGLWAYVYHLKKRPYVLTFLRLIFFFVFVSGLGLCLRFFEAKYLMFAILIMGVIYNAVLYSLAQRIFRLKMSTKNFWLLFIILFLSVCAYFVSPQLSLYFKLTLVFLLFLFSISFVFKEYRAIDNLFAQLKHNT